MNIHVRRASEADREPMLLLWERAVRATHRFLADGDVVALRPFVAMELASDAFDWWVLGPPAGRLVGFLGVSSDTLEALFIDPDHQRQGYGRLLVAHAQSLCSGTLAVDVNEQNDSAVEFYAALGFAVVGRSPTDAGGRPFPILHLSRVSFDAPGVGGTGAAPT